MWRMHDFFSGFYKVKNPALPFETVVAWFNSAVKLSELKSRYLAKWVPVYPCVHTLLTECDQWLEKNTYRSRGCKCVVWPGRQSNISISLVNSRTFNFQQCGLWQSNTKKTVPDSFLRMKSFQSVHKQYCCHIRIGFSHQNLVTRCHSILQFLFTLKVQ
jgi:hypothetical protein